jgi:hypothetical protein
MARYLLLSLLAFFSVASYAAADGLDQRLIIACYRLDVPGVVRCLRDGANVNGTFGQANAEAYRFRDKWTGAGSMATSSWSPLLALASSCRYPDPPDDLGDVWKDQARARALLQQVPQATIDQRERDLMTILQILVSHGCDVNARDARGATALYKAVADNRRLVAIALLQYGADPNTETDAYIDGPSRITPLHVCRSMEVAKLLLDHGADATARDSEGMTPADWLDSHGDREFDFVITPEGTGVRKRIR